LHREFLSAATVDTPNWGPMLSDLVHCFVKVLFFKSLVYNLAVWQLR
jgi:hypothetical protein